MKIIPIIFLSAFFSGCAIISTTSNYEPEAEFDRYQTFYCQECLDEYNRAVPEYDNEENRELIRLGITRELEAKGYVSDREDPDLLVDFHIVIEQKSDLVGESYPVAWQTHDFAFYPVQYEYGTLIVRFTDNRTQQFVWQGTASKILENPKRAQKTIGRAIKKLFKQYQFEVTNGS